ncbi:hypothetical protein Tco_0432247 [Tanacetum coccineum]
MPTSSPPPVEDNVSKNNGFVFSHIGSSSDRTGSRWREVGQGGRGVMNHCGIQRKNTFASSCEEMRSVVSVTVSFDKSEHMVCPKPRRIGLFNTSVNEPVRPLRWHMCYQPEPYESKAGLELLEILFEKGGGYGAPEKTCTEVASSPPFFNGSPPSRVSNPLIQDTRFGDNKVTPVSRCAAIPIPASGMSSHTPSSSEHKVGPVGGNFGNKPAVRIEGFACLTRDNRNNCSISTRA